MYSDGSALEQLSRDECLTLMASVPVGRIIYTQRALPAVELVSYALDHGDIVIRTDRGGKLAAAHGTVVAFEADCLDPAGQGGWSVTAIGPCREVTDPAEVARLQAMGPALLGPGHARSLHRDLAGHAGRPPPARRPPPVGSAGGVTRCGSFPRPSWPPCSARSPVRPGW